VSQKAFPHPSADSFLVCPLLQTPGLYPQVGVLDKKSFFLSVSRNDIQTKLENKLCVWS
jgi:hypothetical protein